jgi:hypothetical protein
MALSSRYHMQSFLHTGQSVDTGICRGNFSGARSNPESPMTFKGEVILISALSIRRKANLYLRLEY